MGVGAGLYMYDVVVKKVRFAISSPDGFLYLGASRLTYLPHDGCMGTGSWVMHNVRLSVPPALCQSKAGIISKRLIP